MFACRSHLPASPPCLLACLPVCVHCFGHRIWRKRAIRQRTCPASAKAHVTAIRCDIAAGVFADGSHKTHVLSPKGLQLRLILVVVSIRAAPWLCAADQRGKAKDSQRARVRILTRPGAHVLTKNTVHSLAATRTQPESEPGGGPLLACYLTLAGGHGCCCDRYLLSMHPKRGMRHCSMSQSGKSHHAVCFQESHGSAEPLATAGRCCSVKLSAF